MGILGQADGRCGMKCPLSYSETVVIGGIECRQPAMECDASCAWAFEWNGKLSCALAIHCVGTHGVNTQPLDDDSDKGGE